MGTRMNGIRDLYVWSCERLYDELAFGYDGVSWMVSGGWWSAWRELALDRVHGRVLELGFGTGELLCALATTGRPVVGLELSPAMHRIAARKLARRGLTAPRVRGTALALPFAAGSFDAVAATFPAPYIVRPETLRECHRVLRPDGRLVVIGLWVAPRGAWAEQRLPVYLGRPAVGAVDGIAARFRQAGFRVAVEEAVCGWAQVGAIIAEKG
jgi:ubiquinone/menaquinone biosynthesis C-methylase UbiE